MASNLSTIGFVFADEETFRSSMVAFAAKTTAQLDCDEGSYGIWRSRSGAELWFHFSPSTGGSTEILGLTPFFEGQSEVELRITGPVHRPNDTAFEGAFYGWIKPDEADSGSYPLVFDSVDFAARKNQDWPALVHAKLVGFARELKCFANEDAYLASETEGGAPHLAPKAFIPIGLFAAAETTADNLDEPPAAPSSFALLSGTVLECSTLANEATGQNFHWLLVESLDAIYDVLADPDVVRGDITVGGTVEASVWLFGRLVERKPSVS